MKTRVRLKRPIEDLEVGFEGIIDGYVNGQNGKPYAVFLCDNGMSSLVDINKLSIIKEDGFYSQIAIDNKYRDKLKSKINSDYSVDGVPEFDIGTYIWATESRLMEGMINSERMSIRVQRGDRFLVCSWDYNLKEVCSQSTCGVNYSILIDNHLAYLFKSDLLNSDCESVETVESNPIIKDDEFDLQTTNLNKFRDKLKEGITLNSPMFNYGEKVQSTVDMGIMGIVEGKRQCIPIEKGDVFVVSSWDPELNNIIARALDDAHYSIVIADNETHLFKTSECPLEVSEYKSGTFKVGDLVSVKKETALEFGPSGEEILIKPKHILKIATINSNFATCERNEPSYLYLRMDISELELRDNESESVEIDKPAFKVGDLVRVKKETAVEFNPFGEEMLIKPKHILKIATINGNCTTCGTNGPNRRYFNIDISGLELRDNESEDE